jgi:hypothetical protein
MMGDIITGNRVASRVYYRLAMISIWLSLIMSEVWI